MAYSTGTLAKGCFGKVYRVKYKGTWAAMKKVPQQLIERKDLERECEVYNKASHPNIVKLLGNITLEEGKWIIPLEFIFGEDLETTIFQASKSKIQMTATNKAFIVTGMCEGLLHLHRNDIVHQDLKPENIMVEHGTCRAVIIDLGLAKFFRHGLNSAIDMGNEAYSAPEVLRRGSQRSQRSDVWAMGKIIAELYARVRLHTPSVNPAKIKETLQGQPYCETVIRMVETDPFRRATMEGVIDEIRKAGEAANGKSAPVKKDLKPTSTDDAPRKSSPSPMDRRLNPPVKNPLGAISDPPSFIKARDPSPFHRDRVAPSPRWEPTPRPEMMRQPLRPQPRPTGSPFTKLSEDRNRRQPMFPPGRTNVPPTIEQLKQKYKAARDLPNSLPKTGKLQMRRVEKNNGKIETWEQTVETEGGKIIRYKDVKVED
ncbi:testis-specific serine/threonine-protein kinase 1 [Fundulus heteroclitus]|uniref:testis-specific serine/threonine-protein kinase 1 n=1 Tax=Fundulus heteroclitus TaxID=8078 RepID=UPI00165CDE35|nr:testis-specific serine/threonine-protein kinase 1 [Fundulus heteroclitus]